MPGKKALKETMINHDIPGISKAILINGKIEYQATGTTSCGFYKKAQQPEEHEYSKYDSSRYILTNSTLYFYDVGRNQLSIIPTEGFQRANLEKYLSSDLNFQKFKEIPSLKQEQLLYINQRVGQKFQPQPIDINTPMGAASLSKPLFSYLILKIIEDKSIQKELGLTDFNLDTKLVDLLPGFADSTDLAKDITVGMVLSHQAGVHDSSQGNDAPEIVFKPGSEFGYSGYSLFYLQMALEKETGQTLQQLAQKYVFTPCKMNNSTFLRKGFEDKHQLPKHLKTVFPRDPGEFSSIAANSLRTTSEDYAKFMDEWMRDEKLAKYLKTPVISMEKDWWAKQLGIDKTQLGQLAWGYGLGMQLDSQGNVEAVFHNGDMNQWRAIITMNPHTRTGAVFFTNSHNGDVLAQEITQDVIDVEPALTYMRDKFGFAVAVAPEWEQQQFERFHRTDIVIAGRSLMAAENNLEMAKSALDIVKETGGDTPTVEKHLIEAQERYTKALDWYQKLLQLSPKIPNQKQSKTEDDPQKGSSTSKMLHGLSQAPTQPRASKENTRSAPASKEEKKVIPANNHDLTLKQDKSTQQESPHSEIATYKTPSPFDISHGPKPPGKFKD